MDGGPVFYVVKRGDLYVSKKPSSATYAMICDFDGNPWLTPKVQHAKVWTDVGHLRRIYTMIADRAPFPDAVVHGSDGTSFPFDNLTRRSRP